MKYLKIPNFADKNILAKSQALVKWFYFSYLFLAISLFESKLLFLDRMNFDPLWPLWWSKPLSNHETFIVVGMILLIGAFLGALFYKKRWARFLAFLSIFQYHALESSFGQPHHQTYLWLYICLFLIFLPNIWGKEDNEEERKKFNLVFWGSQAMILLTYSMSGLWKIFGMFSQLSQGEISILSPNSMALHIADWGINFQTPGVFAHFIVDNPIIGWPMLLFATYVQLFALYFLFKPNLHKFVGLSLIAFHLGTLLFMQITFIQPILILIVFFFDSPFKKERGSLWGDFKTLPIIELFFKKAT